MAIVPKEDAETLGTLSVTVTFPGVDGLFLTVGQVREEADYDVTDEFGKCFALSLLAVARSVRLAWAITVTSSQGQEFD